MVANELSQVRKSDTQAIIGVGLGHVAPKEIGKKRAGQWRLRYHEITQQSDCFA
jgi:hypothetical protein